MSQGGSVYGHQKLQLAQAVLQRRLRVPAQAQVHGARELQHTVGQRQALMNFSHTSLLYDTVQKEKEKLSKGFSNNKLAGT